MEGLVSLPHSFPYINLFILNVLLGHASCCRKGRGENVNGSGVEAQQIASLSAFLTSYWLGRLLPHCSSIGQVFLRAGQ